MNVFVEELSESQLTNIKKNINHVSRSGNHFIGAYSFDDGFLKISVVKYKRFFFTYYEGTITKSESRIDISNAKELYHCVREAFEKEEKERLAKEINEDLINAMKIKQILDGRE